MKKCVRCGKELPDIASFCKHCGTWQVLDESRQDCCSIPSKAALYDKMNWKISTQLWKINNTIFEISAKTHELTQKLLAYTVDSLTDYFSEGIDDDIQNSRCPFYPEVLSLLSNVKNKFDECHSQTLLIAKEVKAAIRNGTGEDIDISRLDLDEKIFSVPPDLNTEDLTDTLFDIDTNISNYLSDVVDLLEEMGDKIDEIICRLSEQN